MGRGLNGSGGLNISKEDEIWLKNGPRTKIGNKVCCPTHNFLYRTYLIISCTELDGKND